MRALGKIHEISMYAGDATFDDADLLLNSGRKGVVSNGVVATIKLNLKPVAHGVVDYLKEDLCRSAFLLCICAVAAAGVAFTSGYTKKQQIQMYLIQLEAELERERDVELLSRNIQALDMHLQTLDSGDKHAVSPLLIEEYIFNISSFFDRAGLGTIEKYYQDKVGELGKNLTSRQMDLFLISGNAAAVEKNHMFLLKNQRHNLSLLSDFASDQKIQSGERIIRLETDARKSLVGTVSIYNSVMDLSMFIGIVFLIIGIASIPGLGRHVRTGFV